MDNLRLFAGAEDDVGRAVPSNDGDDTIVNAVDYIESDVDNVLRFFLKTGRVEEVRWENPSRSKSWTPEMRERARQKSLEQYRKKKEKGDE